MSKTGRPLRKVWSGEEGGKGWTGFRPTMYQLDHKVWRLPLVEGVASDGGKLNETTIGDVLSQVFRLPSPRETATEASPDTASERSASIEMDEQPMLTTIRASGREFVFDGFKNKAFNIEVLKNLVALENEGAPYSRTAWFWYDSDHVLDDVLESYIFFVTHGGKIVRERVAFYDSHGSGFDPSIFKEVAKESPAIWRNEEFWHDAGVRYWYRRFYRETETGQLFALRSDEPTLFHAEEDRWETERIEWLGQLVVHATRIQRLLWAIVILLAGILFFLWR